MDGGVRDIREVGELGFQFFSTEITVAHGYTHVEEVAVPVSILGLDIYPGDLLHADCHGVTVIPHEVAPKLADACKRIVEAEFPMLEPCRQAIKEGRKPAIEELREWRAAMEAARKAALFALDVKFTEKIFNGQKQFTVLLTIFLYGK